METMIVRILAVICMVFLAWCIFNLHNNSALDECITRYSESEKAEKIDKVTYCYDKYNKATGFIVE